MSITGPLAIGFNSFSSRLLHKTLNATQTPLLARIAHLLGMPRSFPGNGGGEVALSGPPVYKYL